MERVRNSPPGLPTGQTIFEVYDSTTMKSVKRLPTGFVERMAELFRVNASSTSRSTVVIDSPWDPLMQATLQQLQGEFRHRIHITHKIS
jgi:hypothetical protein